MHSSDDYQPRSLSAGSRRKRTRKLSKPQRRQQHIDSRGREPGSSGIACENTCSLQHTLQEIPNVGSISVASCGSTGESGDTADPRCVESEKVLGDTEDRVDGIKKESTYEFVVDQWYDLGPCPYKYAYSPASPESLSTEKVEIKDATADGCTEIREASEHSTSKLENRTSNRVPSSGMFDSINRMLIPHSTQVCPSSDREGTSGSTEAAKGTEPNTGIARAGPNGATPMSMLRPFLGCPLTNTGNSFILQPNHFPIPVHAAAPYFHMAAAPATESTSGSSTRVAASHSHSYMPNLNIAHPDTACPRVRTEAGAAALSQAAQSYSAFTEADQVLATPSGMSCSMTLPLLPPNQAPFHSPAVAGHFFAPRYTECQAALDYQEFLYPHNVYQTNSCHSPGVVLVPSHSYYVQQMPFVPLIPAVNCNHLHVARCSARFNAGPHDSGSQPLAADRNLTTSAGSSTTSLLRTTNPGTTLTPIMETDKPGSIEKQAADTLPASQHRARVKVKAKIASSTDFIDPTKIKFGADDVDTEDDLSKLNDCSDCSDKEWQPSNRDLKISCRRDSESLNGWAPKEGGHVELDNSVNKTNSRRRQRRSRELAECNECGKVFKGSYYLRRHQMSHSDIRPFQCSTCHKCFKQKAHLIGHQSVHERALKLNLADGKPASPKPKTSLLGSKCPGRPKKAYSEKDRACKECGKIFKTVYRLKRHELSHTDVRPFSCRICGKAFKQTGHRNEHEANHENTKKRFLCNMCGVVFRCRSSFNNHMRSHGMEKLRLQTTRGDVGGACVENKPENNEICHSGYDCPYCEEKFATAQALNSHLETHVEVQQRRHVQPYSCDVCRRAFTYRHNLIKHKLIHKAPDKFAQFYKEKFEAHVASGKPSFKCTKCSKVFIRKETLAKHCKIHTGSKPFKCAICCHEFTQNVHLKVHMRKHTGSRPFQCKECSKSFIDSTALAKHIEYEACNTDNCLYRCKLCEKMHYYLGSLKKHIRKRHSANEEDVDKYIIKSERSVKRRGASEGETYPCQVCSSSFSEKCNLVRHIKRKHAILVELLEKELEDKHAKVAVVRDITMDPVLKDKESDCDRKLAVVTERPWLICYVPATGATASLEAATNNRDVASSGELDIEKLPSEGFVNTLDEVASSQLRAEGHTLSAKTLEVPPSDLRSTATTEPVNSSVRTNATYGSSDHDIDRYSLSAEDDRARSLLTHKAGTEGTDGYLEGIHGSDFVFSEKQLDQECAHKSLLCKDPCRSGVQGNSCLASTTPSAQREELATSAGQCNIDEESSSPTDIHFLYKIGLVVSSKGKVPGDAVVKHSWNDRDEWSGNPFMPVSKSLTRLGNTSLSSYDPQSHSQLYREEYQSQTPKLASDRSGGLSFLDNASNYREDALATTDDWCSLGCSSESKQNSNHSPPGSSCDEVTASCEMYGAKHNLNVAETHLCVAEHPGGEVEHCPNGKVHHGGTEHHPVEAEHNRTESEHHPSEVEHSSQAEHLHSEVVYHSEVEHRGSEVIYLRTVEHRVSEVDHRVSRVEHHHSGSEPHPIATEHNHIEAEPQLSEGEHSSQLEHHHSEIEHSNQLEHHHSEIEHSNQLEHHHSEIEHSNQLEHHHSEIEHSNQLEHHHSEMEHSNQLEHHHSEMEHSSHLEHHHSEMEHSSQLEHHPSEVELSNQLEHHHSEIEHSNQLEHHPSEVEHSNQLEHHHSEIEHSNQLEHHPSEVEHSNQLEHHHSEIEHSNQLEHYHSEMEHSSHLAHHPGEIEHSSHLEHHPGEAEYNPSQEEYLSQVAPDFNEAGCYPSEARHHSGEAGRHTSEARHHFGEAGRHTSEARHHFGEAGRHPSEARHHSGEAGRHPSEARHHSGEAGRHPSEARHHSGEAGRHPSEARHHSGEAGRHPSEARHHFGEAGRYPSDARHHFGEAGRYPSEARHHFGEAGRHPSEARHHSGEAGRYSSEARHHSGEAGRHPSELEFLTLQCKHHCRNSFTSCAPESDKTFTDHRTAECENQNRICMKNNKTTRMSDTSALQRLETGECDCLPGDRSNWTKLDSEGAHPQLKNVLGETCIASDTVCALSINTSETTRAAQCMPRQQSNRDGEKLQGVKQRTAAAGGGGMSSSVPVLQQCDSEKGKVCMVSPDLGFTLKTSHLLGPKTGVCVATCVEAVTSASGKVLLGAISTRPPSVSPSTDKTAESSRNDTKLHDHVNTEDEFISQKRKLVDSSSLTNMAAKDKAQGLSEYVPNEVVSNPAHPHVHATNLSKGVGSQAWAVERSKNDYEACPTESHIKYLGLLACKDAQEVKNKSTPIKDLYQKYKPWLEEVVHSIRPRRSRFGYKWGTATRGVKSLGSATTVAEQLTYIRRTSFESKEKKRKLRKASVCRNVSSSMEVEDKPLAILGEPNLMAACADSSLAESHTETEKAKEQSLQTSAESGSRDSEVLLTGGHTPRGISPEAQRLATTPPPPASSSRADAHKGARPCPLPATAAVSAVGGESVSGCAESSSPPSTPDSTVKGKQVYVCLVCNKYFTARHQLKRHAMTHTDHRPYTCDKCGRAFRQKVHLSDHNKRHQGQRPFVCAGCGKRFVLKNEMNQHIKNHCRGSLDVFKSVSFLSNKRAFRVAMKEPNPLPGAGEAVTRGADGQGQDCMLMLGQCYRAGDIISNGTITLKVIESAYNQAQEKPDCAVPSIKPTPPLEAPPGTAASQASDCRTSSNGGDSTDQSCQTSQGRQPEQDVRGDSMDL